MTRILALVLLAGLIGCASSTQGTRRNQSVLTTAEIRASSASNALDLVRAQRPQWLRSRGATSIREAGSQAVAVYLDNARMGGPESLGSISLASVQYLRYFGAVEANYRYGTGHDHGVILVSTQPMR